jgi:hypothetical protein
VLSFISLEIRTPSLQGKSMSEEAEGPQPPPTSGKSTKITALRDTMEQRAAGGEPAAILDSKRKAPVEGFAGKPPDMRG